MNPIILRSAVLSAILFAVSLPIKAQSDPLNAHLTGTLLDSGGAEVSGVRVIAQLENQINAQIWSATSTAEGRYVLSFPPGRYHLRFERAPFAARDFILTFTSGESRMLNFQLALERLSSSVIVTANAQPLEFSQTPAPTDVITHQEIEERQIVLLPDLLAMQSGMAITRTGRIGGLTTVFLDGGNSSFAKLLIDGTPVNYPGGDVDYSNLTLDNVDKIEVVHGAESALYGTDAMTGVIQIFTHRGATRIPSGSLFAEGGSFSSVRGGAQVSGLLSGFDYSAAASYFHTDGQGVNDADLNRGFSGNFGYSFSDSNQLRLTVRSNSSFAGIPGQTLLFPPDKSAFYDLQQLFANLTWTFQTGPRWHHRLSGTEARSLSISGFPPFGNFTNQFNRAGFLQQSTYFFRQGALTAGFQYEVENASSFTLGGAHARRNNQGGFLDTHWTPISRLTLVAGARAEANSSFGTRVVPRAGAVLVLRYAKGFWGDTRARVFYGQGIEEPTAFQSFSTDPCSPGNPALRPQRSRTFSAGFDQYLDSDRFQVSATYFGNYFRDLISNSPGPHNPACPFGTIEYLNTDLSRARGVNFSANARLTHWLSLHANYSFDDTRVLKTSSSTIGFQQPGNHLLRRPVNSGNLWFNANLRRLNFNLAAYFTGARTDSDFDGLEITHNPGYGRFDVATSYLLSGGFTVYGRVANLFDKQYQEAVGFPTLGRDVRVGLKYQFAGKD
ncbi:MAG TPA: TonB-dependent receptor [Candidatus Dormibacteraeota bacterium]|nr:TonB-dependent receptor [Candidatus Dormibacteraeota bacterium]